MIRRVLTVAFMLPICGLLVLIGLLAVFTGLLGYGADWNSKGSMQWKKTKIF